MAGGATNMGQFQNIWKEQCSAALTIREHFGLKDAFDYLVGEKLMNFAGAAATRPEFARGLPRFVAEVRRQFTLDEIREHLTRIECEHREAETAAELDEDEDADLFETPQMRAARRGRLVALKELLTSPQLGTS
jgi:hypothetical protein